MFLKLFGNRNGNVGNIFKNKCKTHDMSSNWASALSYMAHLINLALIWCNLQVDGLNRKFNELGVQREISYKLEGLFMGSALTISNAIIW